MTKKTVRILRQLPVDGVLYQPEQLVAFEKTAADQYVEAGAADDNKAAVAYCKGQGVELINHVAPIAQVEAKAAQEATSDAEASGD